MSKDNVFPLHPAPKLASDATVNMYWELAVELMRADTARLLNAETLLGDKPERSVEQDLQRLEQVGLESYIDCNGHRCYRPYGEGQRQRQINRIRDNYEYRAHVESVYRELTERRLTEIDPDWRDHYKTFEAAEHAYWKELQVKTTGGGQFEPPQ